LTARIASALVIVFAAMISAPMVLLALSLSSGFSPVLAHLTATILPEAIYNTLLLLLIVGLGTTIIGVTTAWLITRYRFAGSRILDLVLLLPLAMPAYIIGYAYTDTLGFSGPVQSFLRGVFGTDRGAFWFPDIHAVWGAGLMLTLVLYPYVFLLARTAFLDQSAQCLDAARLAGATPLRVFVQIGIPLARPAIIAGASLAMMETLADFGTVQYFGVNTFTTLIYRSWYGMGDPQAAMQLATGLLAIVGIVVMAEWMSRGARRFYNGVRGQRRIAPIHISGWRAIAAQLACALPTLLGFFIPLGILCGLHSRGGDQFFSPRVLMQIGNSFWLAGVAACVVVAIAFLAAATERWQPSTTLRVAIRAMNLGYAVPGTVIAVAILYPSGMLDRWLASALGVLTGQSYGLLLSGTVVILLFAYLVRFFTVAHRGIETGFSRIPNSIDDVARVLGARPATVLTTIHSPLLRRALLTAGLMVFVDVLKELPATLIIRPFNFDTLAVRVYQLASDERLEQAATGAIMIVLVGIIPVILLMHASRRGFDHDTDFELRRTTLLQVKHLDKPLAAS
jgi:iron(III) transport system permease protein